MKLALTRNPETTALIETLRAVPIGHEISYRTLSEVIGRDVAGPARPRLSSARDICERDHGVVFFSLRGVGLRRIKPEEVPAIGHTARARIRSTSRRGLKAMSAVIGASNGVDGHIMREISTERAALGLLQEIASETARPAFEGAEPAMMPAQAAKSFLKHIGAI